MWVVDFGHLRSRMPRVVEGRTRGCRHRRSVVDRDAADLSVIWKCSYLIVKLSGGRPIDVEVSDLEVFRLCRSRRGTGVGDSQHTPT